MTELKTLKDLYSYDGKFIEVSELKAEAVKWIKQKDFHIYDKEWIKHFFNITDEDLKEEK